MAWCDVVELRTLRECRIVLGQSQAAFAAMLGVSPESYRTWDAGRRATPPHVMARAPALATHRDEHALLPLPGGHPRRHIAAANEGPLVGRPVRHAIFRLVRGMDLRLHPCSVAAAEGHKKCRPNRPTPAGSFRVAPGDHSPEALTRSGLGDFHHPALPLMWLVARGPLPFEVAVT